MILNTLLEYFDDDLYNHKVKEITLLFRNLEDNHSINAIYYKKLINYERDKGFLIELYKSKL